MFAAKEGIVSTLLKKLYDAALKERIQDFDKFLKDKLKSLKDYLTEAAKEAGEAAENLYEDFLEWIRSFDPVRHCANNKHSIFIKTFT